MLLEDQKNTKNVKPQTVTYSYKDSRENGEIKVKVKAKEETQA